MDPNERARLEEEARIKARAVFKTSVGLWLKIVGVSFAVILIGLGTCTYITVHNLGVH